MVRAFHPHNSKEDKTTQFSSSVAGDSQTLASASKEASTAIRSLAAVTVVCLPNTLIAALFSVLGVWEQRLQYRYIQYQAKGGLQTFARLSRR